MASVIATAIIVSVYLVPFVWRLGWWLLEDPKGIGGFVARMALVLIVLYAVGSL